MSVPTKKKQGWLDWIALGSGTFASRTWFFDGNNALLEHDCMVGRRILSVNGKELYNDTVFPDRGFEVTFKIGGDVGKISVVNVHKELAIYYTLTWKGKEVVSKLFDRDDSTDAGATHKDLTDQYTVSVGGTSTRGEVTMYKVTVKDRKSGKSTTIEKRFSEFVELHQKVWSSYAGSHLLSNLPAPPSRKWKLFTNHKSPQFVETRRAGLHKFLTKLMQIPRISYNIYVLQFLEVGAGLSKNLPNAVFVGVAKPGEIPALPADATTSAATNSTTSLDVENQTTRAGEDDDDDDDASKDEDTETLPLDDAADSGAADWI